MSRLTARTAGAVSALVLPILLTSIASADTITIGTFQQIAPRPMLNYTGGYQQFVSSSLVQNPQQRTLVTIDLGALMQAAGLNYLESVTVMDGGGNQYLGSPGADIDYFQLDGLAAGTSTSFSYNGPNGAHYYETSDILAARLAAMDAVSGDQDWNCQHFISLGAAGLFNATFSTPNAPGGGGGGGGGGSGPGEMQGGGGGSGGGTVFSNLVLVTPDLRLHINEAGLGENYIIAITGSSVPAPGAIAGVALTLVRGRGRRRSLFV